MLEIVQKQENSVQEAVNYPLIDLYGSIPEKVQDVVTFCDISPYLAEMKMRTYFKKNDMLFRYFGLIKDGRYMYRATTDSEAVEDAKKAGKQVAMLYHRH